MKLLTIVTASFLATSAYAQSDELIDAATAYVNNPVQQTLMDDMLSVDAVMAQMGMLGATIPAEQLETLSAIVSEELAAIRPALETAMVGGMARTFTLEEITALNEFYSSELGASAMSKMTPFMQDSMAELAPAFQTMQTNIAQRVQEELSK